MEMKPVARRTGLVWVLRVLAVALPLTGGCLWLTGGWRAAGLGLTWGVCGYFGGFYLPRRASTARWGSDGVELVVETGVFWRRTVRLRWRDVQGVTLVQSPLMGLFRLTAAGFHLPGHVLWLDSLLETEAEALTWR